MGDRLGTRGAVGTQIFFLIRWCDFGLDRLIFRIMQNLLVMKKSPQINFSPQNVSVINFYRITASKRKLG